MMLTTDMIVELAILALCFGAVIFLAGAFAGARMIIKEDEKFADSMLSKSDVTFNEWWEVHYGSRQIIDY